MIAPFKLNAALNKPSRLITINRHGGYTLLEIILIVSLISIMLLIGFINLQKPVAHHKLHVSARKMQWDIKALQARALTEERLGYKIYFLVDPGRNKDIDSYYIMQGITILKARELPPGINLYEANFDSEKLNINRSGYPESGMGGSIQIENKFGEKLYVVINKTGRVRIDDQPPPK